MTRAGQGTGSGSPFGFRPQNPRSGEVSRKGADRSAAIMMLAATFWLKTPVAETRDLRVGAHPLTVEVAVSNREQRRGLMGREHLAENAGMLFVWDDEAPRVMWMKDTLIPLSVAFVDATGHIVNIERMTPETTTPHWSKHPARYAIETRQGWFRDRGIVNGDYVNGLEPH
ncbi:MAG: DUF192 domain-containing protein [Pseudomonadota bacterium]|nr:DUF192 domain-containing protein [Pseudomonadota bacterium]